MINYFDEAEKMLQSRGSLETALANLERRRERILKQSGPAGYPSPDMSKPYSSTKNVNDALTECLELAEIVREIQVTQDTMREIDLVLDQLGDEDRAILRLWYIEHKPKEEIASAINYASITSVYDIRNKAVSRFALLYFGAGALASV
jgi:DNA-directed RNA polymerase specialized sigma24 family protein